MTGTIEVQDIHKRYGDVTAVDGVTFEVHRGEFFEGLEGAGDDGTHDAPDSLWHDAPTGHEFTYEDAEWGPEPDDVVAHDFEDLSVTEEEPAGLLDGIDFDLSSLDLGALSDTDFDASYDLIGSSPGEQGWWSDLVSDHNHDGAYETVSADESYVSF